MVAFPSRGHRSSAAVATLDVRRIQNKRVDIDGVKRDIEHKTRFPSFAKNSLEMICQCNLGEFNALLMQVYSAKSALEIDVCR